jgi:hypothetical protein
MAKEQNDDIGMFARHPLRTMAGAMMVGASLGSGMMAAKNHRYKTPMQKFFDRMNTKT